MPCPHDRIAGRERLGKTPGDSTEGICRDCGAGFLLVTVAPGMGNLLLDEPEGTTFSRVIDWSGAQLTKPDFFPRCRCIGEA